MRAIADAVGKIGKTQVGTILKNKESILSTYESNCSTSKKARTSKFCDINEALYEWYLMACSKNIYPNGPTLTAKAKEIAARLGKTEFEGSSGWLTRWKQRYNVKRITICGESGDVSGETVTSWKERLPEIVSGYAKRNIFNWDEAGCFWRALPTRGFGRRGKKCKGGKKSKQRFTIAFLVNAAGEKETPIVIWKSARPRCFKNFDINSLPVKYYHQDKAWMTGQILHSYLTSFNAKMKAEKRSILLLMDNAGCHPPEVLQGYSNIKIVFLPANTTSKLQPLDLGIIANFKVHFRRHLLQYVAAKIDTATSATEIIKSVNVLIAIRWVALSWREVKVSTIQKCFRNAGVLESDLEVREISDEDPFLDVDGTDELSSLISSAMGDLDHCSVEEYIDGDFSLPVCVELDDEWDENFLSGLTREEDQDSAVVEQSDDDDEGEDMDILPPVPKTKSFREAIHCLEDIKLFLEDKGLFDQASSASSLINKIASSYSSTLRQATLDHFFPAR